MFIPISIEQVLEEVVEAVLPGQPQRAAREERRHGVARRVVQPALRAQLAHRRVHEREARAPRHPSGPHTAVARASGAPGYPGYPINKTTFKIQKL